MEGAHIECGRRITDSLIGRRVRVLSSDQSLPKVHRLVRGDLLLEETLEEAVHRGPTTTGSGPSPSPSTQRKRDRVKPLRPIARVV